MLCTSFYCQEHICTRVLFSSVEDPYIFFLFCFSPWLLISQNQIKGTWQERLICLQDWKKFNWRSFRQKSKQQPSLKCTARRICFETVGFTNFHIYNRNTHCLFIAMNLSRGRGQILTNHFFLSIIFFCLHNFKNSGQHTTSSRWKGECAISCTRCHTKKHNVLVQLVHKKFLFERRNALRPHWNAKCSTGNKRTFKENKSGLSTNLLTWSSLFFMWRKDLPQTSQLYLGSSWIRICFVMSDLSHPLKRNKTWDSAPIALKSEWQKSSRGPQNHCTDQFTESQSCDTFYPFYKDPKVWLLLGGPFDTVWSFFTFQICQKQQKHLNCLFHSLCVQRTAITSANGTSVPERQMKNSGQQWSGESGMRKAVKAAVIRISAFNTPQLLWHPCSRLSASSSDMLVSSSDQICRPQGQCDSFPCMLQTSSSLRSRKREAVLNRFFVRSFEDFLKYLSCSVGQMCPLCRNASRSHPPVVAVRTFEWLLRFVNSQMSFQMRLSRELPLAQVTAVQDFRWHVHHLDVHFQDVRILQ